MATKYDYFQKYESVIMQSLYPLHFISGILSCSDFVSICCHCFGHLGKAKVPGFEGCEATVEFIQVIITTCHAVLTVWNQKLLSHCFCSHMKFLQHCRPKCFVLFWVSRFWYEILIIQKIDRLFDVLNSRSVVGYGTASSKPYEWATRNMWCRFWQTLRLICSVLKQRKICLSIKARGTNCMQVLRAWPCSFFFNYIFPNFEF